MFQGMLHMSDQMITRAAKCLESRHFAALLTIILVKATPVLNSSRSNVTTDGFIRLFKCIADPIDLVNTA